MFYFLLFKLAENNWFTEKKLWYYHLLEHTGTKNIFGFLEHVGNSQNYYLWPLFTNKFSSCCLNVFFCLFLFATSFQIYFLEAIICYFIFHQKRKMYAYFRKCYELYKNWSIWNSPLLLGDDCMLKGQLWIFKNWILVLNWKKNTIMQSNFLKTELIMRGVQVQRSLPGPGCII